MSPTEPESVIMNISEVPPGRQRELIDALPELLGQSRLIDGFVDGRIHASLDGSKVISYSTMRSAADHHRLEDRSEIREGLNALELIAVSQATPQRTVVDGKLPSQTAGFTRCIIATAGASLGRQDMHNKPEVSDRPGTSRRR